MARIETLDDLAQTECCRLGESIIKKRDVGANITIATHPQQHVDLAQRPLLGYLLLSAFTC